MSEAGIWKGLMPARDLPCRGKGERQVHTLRTHPSPKVESLTHRPGRRPQRTYEGKPNPWDLSPAQFVVLERLATKTAAVVATELGISSKTVNAFVERAREKMNAATTLIAVVMFDRWQRAVGMQDVEIVIHLVEGVPTTLVRVLEREPST